MADEFERNPNPDTAAMPKDAAATTAAPATPVVSTLPAPAPITISADQLPAGIKVGPWQTVEFFDKDNNLIGHFDSSIAGTQTTVLSTDKELAPITARFTQHPAPAAEATPAQALPSDVTVVN